MILMIDNYDSFTFNLVQYFRELGQEVEVYRNDVLTEEQLHSINPSYLVISPGPCTPDESGISLNAIKHFAGKVPILGVCLGHQAICQAFGGSIVQAPKVVHGYTSDIHHSRAGIFKDLPTPFKATRYHSLVVDEKSLHDDFQITAWTDEGGEDINQSDQKLIMGIRHKSLPIEGIQFHPESILTEHGHQLLRNFLELN